MYIVRRTFRGHKGPLSAGTVIEPADVRDFQYRLREKHIVEVNEQNFDEVSKFFEERYEVEIPHYDPVERARLADEKAKEEADKAAAEAKAKEEADKAAAEAKAKEEADKAAAEAKAKEEADKAAAEAKAAVTPVAKVVIKN